MKKFIFIVFFTFLFLPNLCLAQTKGIKIVPVKDRSGSQVGLYKGSFALIIGAADYTAGWPTLPSVINETKEIEIALRLNGFSVHRVLNPSEAELKKELDQFIDKYGYEKDNRLLVFFSGHGYSRKRGAKGYLVPIDAPDPRKDEKGFLRKALPMSQVLAWCRQMESKHVLFLFDSCFSGTVFKTKALPEVPPHISAITSRSVRQFISAGDAGEEVPAKSVFAECFLRALRGEADLSKDGYVTGSELGMYLRDKVLYYRTGQTPQYGKIRDPDLDEGDFVFLVTTEVEDYKPSVTESRQDIPSLTHIVETPQTVAPALKLPIEGTWKFFHMYHKQDFFSVTFSADGSRIVPGDLRFYPYDWAKFVIENVTFDGSQLVLDFRYTGGGNVKGKEGKISLRYSDNTKALHGRISGAGSGNREITAKRID